MDVKTEQTDKLSHIEGVDDIAGLVRRHVGGLAIFWKDTPPDFVKRGRREANF